MTTTTNNTPAASVVRDAITANAADHVLDTIAPKLAAAAMANPDWRAGCVIEPCQDGNWNVYPPDRSAYLRPFARGWNSYSNLRKVVPGLVGEFETQQKAIDALAACPTPYPGYEPCDLAKFDNAMQRDRMNAVEAATEAGVCEECGGVGHVQVVAVGAGVAPPGYVHFERCDACEKYDSDLEAALAFGLVDIREQGSGLVGRLPQGDDGSPSQLPERVPAAHNGIEGELLSEGVRPSPLTIDVSNVHNLPVRLAADPHDKRVECEELIPGLFIHVVRTVEDEDQGGEMTGRRFLDPTGEWYITLADLRSALVALGKAIVPPEVEVEPFDDGCDDD